MTAVIKAIAEKMSPYHNVATLAVVGGAIDTATLHAARLEIARFTDRIAGRETKASPGRKRLIDMGRKAYDAIAYDLAKRGEL